MNDKIDPNGSILFYDLVEYNYSMSYLRWSKLVLGVWVFVSPWVLGFDGYPLALWSNIISGTAIVILTLWNLFGKGMEMGNKK